MLLTFPEDINFFMNLQIDSVISKPVVFKQNVKNYILLKEFDLWRP